jgi:hypothetical protein
MSKAVELIKEGGKSLERTAKGALKGDVNDILTLGSLGGTKQLESAGKQLHKPFKAPDPLPTPGLSQANVQDAAPDVDLAFTEASRRTSGQAVGTRKLRIPLGGLR